MVSPTMMSMVSMMSMMSKTTNNSERLDFTQRQIVVSLDNFDNVSNCIVAPYRVRSGVCILVSDYTTEMTSYIDLNC